VGSLVDSDSASSPLTSGLLCIVHREIISFIKGQYL